MNADEYRANGRKACAMTCLQFALIFFSAVVCPLLAAWLGLVDYDPEPLMAGMWVIGIW